VVPTGIERNGWVFAQLDVDGAALVEFASGSHLFDLRFFSSAVADDTYFDLYMNDVVQNKGEKFLPGYVE
jgi:hypothetical protein